MFLHICKVIGEKLLEIDPGCTFHLLKSSTLSILLHLQVVYIWQFRKCPLWLPERFRHDGIVPVHQDTNQQVGTEGSPVFRCISIPWSVSGFAFQPICPSAMSVCATLCFSPDRYKMSLLKPSTKALALSCKVSVRTDTRGFLSLQYLIRNDDGQICFVEYFCCPDVEVDDEWFPSQVSL